MYSFVSYLGTGAQTDFAIPFPYLSQSHIEASVNSVPVSITFPNAGTARFSPAPAAGAVVALRRNTSRAARLIDFATSSTVTESDLDTDSLQAFYLAQEAIDQATSGSYFSADANGSRVVNVADPVNDTDGVNKQFLVSYITSLGLGSGGGLDLRPLNNTWTGTNTFNSTVTVKGATFDGTDVASKEYLYLDKALYTRNTSTSAGEIVYGYATQAKKTGGLPFAVGGQILGINLVNAANGWAFGIATEAWNGKDARGTVVGLESAAINLNPDNKAPKVGVDSVFRNREANATQGGNAATILGTTGYGTGNNYYNANAWAYTVSSATRSDSNATYVGWSRGLVFRDGWCDISRVAPYDGAAIYAPGDQVLSGGVAYQCKEACTGVAPPSGTYWAPLLDGDARKAIGIDFSGVSGTTAGRMLAAIKLRANMSFLWDTEEQIGTHFDALVSGRWKLMNSTFERFGIHVPTGDIYINGSNRVLATQSLVNVKGGGSAITLSTGWNNITLPVEDIDNRSEHSAGSIIPNTPGVYLVNAQVTSEGASSTNGLRLLAGIAKNGTLVKAASTLTAGSKDVSVNVTALVAMNGTTDSLSLQAYSSGPTVYLTGEPTVTFLQVTKVS